MANFRPITAAWLVLAAVYAVVAILAVNAWRQGTRVGVDVQFTGDVGTVARVTPRDHVWHLGVREGFRLVTIDGAPATPQLWAERNGIADSLTFTDLSGETVVANIADDGSLELPAVIALEITASVFALTSLIVFSRAWRSREASVFALFAIVSAVGVAAIPGSVSGYRILEAIFAVSLLWIPVSFIGFFHVLGGNPIAYSRYRISLWIVLPSSIAGLLTVITILEHTTTPSLEDFSATAGLVFLASGLLLGLGLLVARYLRSDSETFKEQIRVITVGTTIAIFPLVLLSVIPNGAGLEQFVPAEIPLTATVIIPLSFGYAIMRHELLGIRRLVHRGVAYVLISALVVAFYAAILGVIKAWTDVGDSSAVNLAILIALLGIPLVPRVREVSFAIVDRLLYRDFMDHREVVRDVSLRAVETETVDELISRVLSEVGEPLGLQFVAYLEDDGRSVSIRNIMGEADEDVLRALYRSAVDGNGSGPGTRLATEPSLEGQVALVSLPGAGGRAALACLGPKKTGEPFSDDDLQMIQTISGLLTTAVARLQLLGELQQKNEELVGLNVRLIEVEEQERARLSGYLHDEPLQKVAYVLSQYRERNLGEDLGVILDEAVSDLRNISASLSPVVLTDLGLVSAVDWLVSETEGRAGFQINFDVKNPHLEKELAVGTQLVAYRVVQESLTNCQKHSQASAVWVSLEFDSEGVVVSIEDNGVGVPEGPDSATRRPDSLGLLSMRQRIDSQDGSLALENRRSRGFSVKARLPFNRSRSRSGPGVRRAIT